MVICYFCSNDAEPVGTSLALTLQQQRDGVSCCNENIPRLVKQLSSWST